MRNDHELIQRLRKFVGKKAPLRFSEKGIKQPSGIDGHLWQIAVDLQGALNIVSEDPERAIRYAVSAGYTVGRLGMLCMLENYPDKDKMRKCLGASWKLHAELGDWIDYGKWVKLEER